MVQNWQGYPLGSQKRLGLHEFDGIRVCSHIPTRKKKRKCKHSSRNTACFTFRKSMQYSSRITVVALPFSLYSEACFVSPSPAFAAWGRPWSTELNPTSSNRHFSRWYARPPQAPPLGSQNNNNPSVLRGSHFLYKRKGAVPSRANLRVSLRVLGTLLVSWNSWNFMKSLPSWNVSLP